LHGFIYHLFGYNKTMKRHEESGSVMWFILLAVALLAALTITITRSSDTSENTGKIEQNKVLASALLRYAAGLEAAADQMRLRGLPENAVSFENTTVAGYANATCPDASCQLFNTAGGGMAFIAPPSGANDGSSWLFTGANQVAGIGAAETELLMILPDVDKKLCTEINAENGVTGIPQAAGQVDISTKYTGSFASPGFTIDVPAGKKTGCFQGNQDETGADISARYFVYHTIITR
jgi:hypothetical protein